MNQHLHRIIFNAARGCLMAVAETSRANGKAASPERGAPQRNARHTRGFQPSSLQWMCWLAVGALVVNHTSPVVWAQTTVMADPTAPRNQQPTVLRAGNSTVQVNIQTPNAAGLSRNNYKQFDILADGVILNNSRTQTNTNLGGWIEANPWLAKGTAKVILNQVNSIHPSLLKGPVEVAVGSSITSSGNTTLSAGNDLTAKAANVQAGGTLNVNAGNDRVALLVAY